METVRLKKLVSAILICLILRSTPVSSLSPASAPQFLPGLPVIAGDQVILCWSPLPGAQTYNIYLDGEFLATVDSTCYKGFKPDRPGSFIYQVSAVDPYGAESERSSPGRIRIHKHLAPRNLIAEVGSNFRSIELIWDTIPGISIYKVYRAEGNDEMILLAAVRKNVYRDKTVKPGSKYVYAVSALDLIGSEGPRSSRVSVEMSAKISAKIKADTSKSYRDAIRGFSAREVLSITTIHKRSLREVSYLGIGSGNEIWVVMPEIRAIHALGPGGEVLSTFGPPTFNEVGFPFIPHKLDIGPDGNIYVSDVENGAIAGIDREGKLLWVSRVKTPSKSNEEVWLGFPQRIRKLPATPSSVLCLPEEIWVTDQRFQLFYRFSYDGELLGYHTTYKKNGNTWRFRRVGEIERIRDNNFLLTFPLARKAIVVDNHFRVVFEIAGNWRTSADGFLGVHGVQWIPGDRILLTDPALGTIRVFNATDGSYLFDITQGDGNHGLGLRKPNMAVWSPAGRIWVYVSGENRIAVLELDSPSR